LTSDFLRRYIRDVDPDRDVAEPWLSTAEFMDYLLAPENCFFFLGLIIKMNVKTLALFDPVNRDVIHDMTKASLKTSE
jgi:hypothetical protein